MDLTFVTVSAVENLEEACTEAVQSRAMSACNDEVVNVCCKDDIVSILRDLPLKEVAVVGFFRIAGRGRNVHLAILTITIKQFALCGGLRDIHVIGMHIVLRSDSEKHAEAGR